MDRRGRRPREPEEADRGEDGADAAHGETSLWRRMRVSVAGRSDVRLHLSAGARMEVRGEERVKDNA